MRIKYVNGFKIRNTTDSDFDGHSTHDYDVHIPRGVVWVEDYLKPEIDLILSLVKWERKFFSQKKPFDELRDFVKKLARQNGSPPPFRLRGEKKGRLKIFYVDGAIVRKYLDPYFFSGGHDLVYDYIPKNEVWIDDRNYKEDHSFVLIHELFERNLMARGRDYDSAHDFAIAEEKDHRRRAGVAQFTTG